MQALASPNRRARMWFCQLKCIVTEFVDSILFTDEAGLTRDDIVNFHNTHAWMDDNPHTTMSSRHPYWFSIDVCVGILPNKLTGAVYHRFLLNDLPVFLEHVPPYQQHVWLTRGGASSHFLRMGRQHLDQIFGKLWAGRGGPSSSLHDPLALILWTFDCGNA
jgi:hypothetical protein